MNERIELLKELLESMDASITGYESVSEAAIEFIRWMDHVPLVLRQMGMDKEAATWEETARNSFFAEDTPAFEAKSFQMETLLKAFITNEKKTMISEPKTKRGMKEWRINRACLFRVERMRNAKLSQDKVAERVTNNLYDELQAEIKKEHPQWKDDEINAEAKKRFMRNWNNKVGFYRDDVKNDYIDMNWEWGPEP